MVLQSTMESLAQGMEGTVSVPKYRIAIWPTGEAEPQIKTVVLPPDDFGTVSADIERIQAEIDSNKADGQVDKYEITAVANDEIDLQEATEWLESFREQ